MNNKGIIKIRTIIESDEFKYANSYVRLAHILKNNDIDCGNRFNFGDCYVRRGAKRWIIKEKFKKWHDSDYGKMVLSNPKCKHIIYYKDFIKETDSEPKVEECVESEIDQIKNLIDEKLNSISSRIDIISVYLSDIVKKLESDLVSDEKRGWRTRTEINSLNHYDKQHKLFEMLKDIQKYAEGHPKFKSKESVDDMILSFDDYGYFTENQQKAIENIYAGWKIEDWRENQERKKVNG